MKRQRQPSKSAISLLGCLAQARGGLHGYALMKSAGLASGTLYPILKRLTERGWLEKNWDIQPDETGPPRRLYTLTPLGYQNWERLCALKTAETAPLQLSGETT